MKFAQKLLSLQKFIFIFLAVIFAEVTALEPTITEPPAKLYEAVEGHTVSLRCRVSGAPQPQVSWLRDGKELTGDRYNTQDNGDLEITELQITDAGRYKCIARNKLGNDSSDDSLGHLEVKSRTVIAVPPENHVFRTGGNAFFQCYARADSTLELDIEWLRNGQVIDYDKDPRIILDSNLLYLEKTTELDLGIYTCVAKTRLDNATSSARLIFKGVPSAPKLVGVKCDQNTAHLDLQTIADNRTPAWRFTVEKNTSVTPDTWQREQVNVPETDRTIETRSFKASMNPWANYTFRVIATNKYGSSLPSGVSAQRCETPPDVPYKNPDRVRAHGDKPDNLVISWMPMTPLERNGPGFFYRVLWKRKSIDVEYWMKHDIYDLHQRRHMVNNTPSFVEYNIKVEAHNSMGQAKVAATEIAGFSGENVPLEAPSNLTVIRVINEETAELSWDPVPADSVRGHFVGYKIQSWTEEETIQRLREKVVSPEVTQSRVNLFVPYGENFVRVLAFNNEYDGPASEVLRLNTAMPDQPDADVKGSLRDSINPYSLTWKVLSFLLVW